MRIRSGLGAARGRGWKPTLQTQIERDASQSEGKRRSVQKGENQLMFYREARLARDAHVVADRSSIEGRNDVRQESHDSVWHHLGELFGRDIVVAAGAGLDAIFTHD